MPSQSKETDMVPQWGTGLVVVVTCLVFIWLSIKVIIAGPGMIDTPREPEPVVYKDEMTQAQENWDAERQQVQNRAFAEAMRINREETNELRRYDNNR